MDCQMAQVSPPPADKFGAGSGAHDHARPSTDSTRNKPANAAIASGQPSRTGGLATSALARGVASPPFSIASPVVIENPKRLRSEFHWSDVRGVRSDSST